MKFTSSLAAALVALAFSGAAAAAGKAAASPAQQQYQQERARCLSGQSQQDKATCLKEAQAALQESRREQLATAPKAQLSQNATDRCKAQPAADQAACVARITGAGSTEGSVKAGGLLRQTETKTP